jgi:hypothetical protein
VFSRLARHRQYRHQDKDFPPLPELVEGPRRKIFISKTIARNNPLNLQTKMKEASNVNQPTINASVSNICANKNTDNEMCEKSPLLIATGTKAVINIVVVGG